MNKRFLSLLAVSFIFITGFADEILVAPFSVYDAKSNKITMKENPSVKLYGTLQKSWFEGLISFSLLKEEKYEIPVTILDANKICANENANLILYGSQIAVIRKT